MSLKPYDEMPHHPMLDDLVGVLSAKTHNKDPLFFRVMCAYYFAQAASMQRCSINTVNQGNIPVNMYAINLAPSGAGKGYSMNILEDQVVDKFRHRFQKVTLPALAEKHISQIALQRGVTKGTPAEDEKTRLEREYAMCGPLLFSFDSGTSAAVKQIRHKLLLAGAGSMNLQMDEMGANLLSNVEVLDTYIELFDVGKLKQKLVKNTADNARFEEVEGRTPTNMLLFGTPTRLLDGGKTEDEFYAMLQQGYARRCLFGYARAIDRSSLTADDIMNQWADHSQDTLINQLSDHFGKLADLTNYDRKLDITMENSALFAEYHADCIRRASKLPPIDDVKIAEMEHRHFKALKLAGCFAFVDGTPEITEDQIYSAIRLTEDCGRAFHDLLTRDRNHVKLAKYIAVASGDTGLTQSDLVQDLPYYKGPANAKADMMNLATAWGYQNNIVIRRTNDGEVEFFHGETMEETDLNKMIVSYSRDFTENYYSETPAFNEIHKLTQAPGIHWINHALIDGDEGEGYRSDEKCIAGFNMVVIDVDHNVDLSTAQKLLKDYKAHYYTTKRHSDAENRFRILLPTNYVCKLNTKDFKDFMKAIYEWLPFEVDEVTNQRSRKWLSHKGHYSYNDGELLDVTPFIPRTSRNEKWKNTLSKNSNLDNLERWVTSNAGDGNRNNQLYKYGMILVDAGFDFEPIRQRVNALNNKLSDPIPETEIMATIMVSIGKALSAKP